MLLPEPLEPTSAIARAARHDDVEVGQRRLGRFGVGEADVAERDLPRQARQLAASGASTTCGRSSRISAMCWNAADPAHERRHVPRQLGDRVAEGEEQALERDQRPDRHHPVEGHPRADADHRDPENEDRRDRRALDERADEGDARAAATQAAIGPPKIPSRARSRPNPSRPAAPTRSPRRRSAPPPRSASARGSTRSRAARRSAARAARRARSASPRSRAASPARRAAPSRRGCRATA